LNDDQRTFAMSDDWFTYAQAAERLNLAVEAVRLRALRGRWQKTIGNDKRPRIRLPEGWSNDVQTPVERRERKPRNDVQTPVERAVASALAHALESQIKGLEGELAGLREALAEARARAGAAETRLAEGAAREAALAGDLAAERARTSEAIAAFRALADRLDALAAERARPWWRRLVG
jgi:hypothetical protein